MALLGAIDPVAGTQPLAILQSTDIVDPGMSIVDEGLIDSTVVNNESAIMRIQPVPDKPQKTVLLYRWKG